jgi:hypothetical protein
MRISAKLALRTALGVAVLAGTAIGASASNSALALDFTTPTVNFTNLNWSLGWRFTTKTDVNVTAFCYYDDNRDGMLSNHEVAIYNTATQVQLLRTDVLKSDPFANGNYFRCHTLATPLFLPKGGDWIITGSTRNDNYTWNPGGLTIDPAIAYVEDRFEPSNAAGFAVYPHQTDSTASAYFGPSFELESVPEGSSIFMLLGGIPAALLVVRSRRYRK